MSFQIEALSPEPFRDLFALPVEALAAVEARRVRVDAKPGYPCRVSLEDAEVGEDVILVQYSHQPERSPFRSSHAIFVRHGVERASPRPGEVPELLRSRLLSVRAFNAAHEIVAAKVTPGEQLESVSEALLADTRVAYLHMHNAGLGCYLARVVRASAD